MADPHPLYFQADDLIRAIVEEYHRRNKIIITAAATRALLEPGLSYSFNEIIGNRIAPGC